MADLAPTAITLGGISTTVKSKIQFGEVVAAMELVYLNADGKYYKSSSNTSILTAAVVGIAILGGLTDAFGVIVTGGPIILAGVAMDVGDAYYGSRTAGLMPQLDLAAGDWTSNFGEATAATILEIAIKNNLTPIT